MRTRLRVWLHRARAAVSPGPRLTLPLACGLLVLVPALLAAELALRGYAQVQLDEARARSLVGLDATNTLIQQENIRALDNAQLVAERLGPLAAADGPADLVQAVTDARAAIRATTLVAVVDASGHVAASDPATNLQLGADSPVKNALGGKLAGNLVNRVPLAIEAAAPLGPTDPPGAGAAVVAVNVDDALANTGLRLSGLEVGLVQNVQGTPRLVAASRSLRRSVSVAQDTAVTPDLVTQSGDQFQRLQVGADAFWLALRPLARVNGSPIGVLLVGLPADVVEAPVRQARLFADGAALLSALLAGVCGLLLGNALARRLRRLVETARHIGRGGLPPGRSESMRGPWAEANRALAEAAVRVEDQLAAYRFRATRLEAVLGSLAEGVIVADADRDVVLVNPAARALLDGNGVADSQRIIRSYSATVRAENAEQPLGTVTVLRDATREQELDRLKSEFLTVVSHELQTPLTAIKGALELVLDDDSGQLSRVQRRFLDTIERNCSRLVGLVGDLLDMSRLEAGRVELNAQPLDTPSLIRSVVATLGNLFDSRDVRVTVDVSDSVPPILGDRRRVEQILTNLLANAAKYTPTGGQVEVTAWSTETQVSLAVADTGPGIPEADREVVFDKFYRGPEAIRRGEAGSGLGLAIVKSLVELHGGSVRVESATGARFVVNLPRAIEEE